MLFALLVSQESPVWLKHTHTHTNLVAIDGMISADHIDATKAPSFGLLASGQWSESDIANYPLALSCRVDERSPYRIIVANHSIANQDDDRNLS